MVAGMTPSTVDGDFVASTINAGYHIELAGGGHYNERNLRKKVKTILDNISPGRGITINSLFINQKQWNFQFPLIVALRKEGVPIEGFTVAAGIPSIDNAREIISTLQEAGIRHVSFKPGSLEGILQVVNIAKANPSFPIILQWTGGRAGGHHSYEDVHHPILESYSAIRNCENICLVIGSGFGDGPSILPYITGSWSLKYDYPRMPFDGALMGSRMMVAKECKTSKQVKELIVSIPGVVDEKDWEKSYRESTGGVVTVISELGEPIHKVATKAVLLWKEFDEKIFKLPRDQRLKKILSMKDYIVTQLNANGHKVWFGKSLSSAKPVDLETMTYKEVTIRLAELLYVPKLTKWIDNSYQRLFFDFLQRAEERLLAAGDPSCIPSKEDLVSASADPWKFLEMILQNKPFDLDTIMTSEDCLYFITLCKRPGQKPVPFVPILDEDFETWYKKDSLWQSENVDCLIDQDPQRACILQGPVAARYCTRANETVSEILEGISSYLIDQIVIECYNKDKGKIPTEEWICSYPSLPYAGSCVSLRKGRYQIESEAKFRNMITDLLGTQKSWISALLFSEHIWQDGLLVANPLYSIISQCTFASFEILSDAELVFYDTESRTALKLSYTRPAAISAIFFYYTEVAVSKLELKYSYHPDCPIILIHEDISDREMRIKQFYWSLWFGSIDSGFEEALAADPLTTQFKSSFKLQTSDITKFTRVIGNNSALYTETQKSKKIIAPIDYAIVAAWKAVTKCLFPKAVRGDMLKLVHLSNKFSYLSEHELLHSEQTMESVASVNAIQWTPTGKIVEVEGIISSNGKDLVKVTSSFMFKGAFKDEQLYFRRQSRLRKKMLITSKEDLAALKSKSWINWIKDNYSDMIKENSTIIAELSYLHINLPDKNVLKRAEVTGKLFLQIDTKEYMPIANVAYTNELNVMANPVLDYFDRHNHPFEEPTVFDSDGIPIAVNFDLGVVTCESNQNYSDISGDHNPIHTNPLFSSMAGLPGCITHGMWTSAAVRSVIERYVCENQPLRLRDYHVEFLDMVLPQERLDIKLWHIGMKRGRKVIKVNVLNARGSKVMTGESEIDQPKTAYVFTGQGSQEIGMGMDLYDSSEYAKAIWDRADKHFSDNYGFSILNVVRANPKSLTIYFGGPKGRKIRSRYQDLKYQKIESGNKKVLIPLFPSISDNSSSYTFSSPNGLLFATQFTQPALTLMEKACYEDMRKKGFANPHSLFAGHSLGEYAALASVGDVLSIETLCDIVFYRGLTMQVAVERDQTGRSKYGMIAVNPSRLAIGLNDTLLKELIGLIAKITSSLLEIVNYNVEDWQYVVAGELSALATLTGVLDYIGTRKHNLFMELASLGQDAKESALKELTCPIFAKYRDQAFIVLERGLATIPLVGIDVPFHSTFLRSGVESFRGCLSDKIKAINIDPALLVGKYIPNLTGALFEISQDYIIKSLKHCDSAVLKELLENWKGNLSASEMQEIARILLIELLAYQFASPVRWIETQDVLFKDLLIERIVEIGPSPVLAGMAERTLKIKYREFDRAHTQDRQIWHFLKNKPEIYYENIVHDSTPAAKEPVKEDDSATNSQQQEKPKVSGVQARPAQRIK